MRLSKWWVRSRTIVFNAVLAGLAGAEAQFHLLQPVLPANAYAVLSFVLIVGNVVLRVLTTGPVTLRRNGA